MTLKALIFDLDGVIIESAEIKTRAFELLFADYTDKLPAIVEYHIRNAGLSRYVKFRYFYEKLLGQELSSEKEKELGERYSQIVVEQVLKAPLVTGAVDFLRNNKRRYLMFVASGTPEEELREIVKQRGLYSYFRGVYGTPRTKPELIKQILAEHHLAKDEAVFIGDAESDRMAAKQADVNFIARISEDDALDDCVWKIQDFTDLAKCLAQIDRQLGKAQSKK